MPVNRQLFQSNLSDNHAPNWPCPSCGGGHYRLSKENIKYGHTSESKKTKNSLEADIFNTEYRFVAILECDNNGCREIASVAGVGEEYEWYDDDENKLRWDTIFYPRYCHPSPKLITIPTNCPDEVSEELLRCFEASWGDYSSAGNSIRCAVERLLDNLGVDKANMKGKQIPLSQRIEKLKDTEQEVKDYLNAIKILGNSGSHSNNLTRNDVFDALDIFEDILQRMYGNNKDELRALVSAIHSQNSPIRPVSIF